MPAAHIEFDNGDESLHGVGDFGDMKEDFRMGHEAIYSQLMSATALV